MTAIDNLKEVTAGNAATENGKLLAFHNDPLIKEHYLQRVEAHRAADEIVHGIYWQKGKGCAVGCTVHSSDHSAYERELGIPRILARLEEGIFESMANGRAKDWPVEFLSSIRVGADLSRVWPQFAVWLLGDPVEGVVRFAKSDRTRSAIMAIVQAYSLEQLPDSREWRRLRGDAAAAAADAYADAYAAAADAAADAAAADAYAAATAAAAYAYAAAAADAYDAAADAAAAADADAYAAAAADAYDAAADAAAAARQQAWTKQADKLLELLKAA